MKKNWSCLVTHDTVLEKTELNSCVSKVLESRRLLAFVNIDTAACEGYYDVNVTSNIPSAASAVGNTFQIDDAAITSNFALEAEIFHALDNREFGLVTYVAGNVFLTIDDGDHDIDLAQLANELSNVLDWILCG